MNENTEQYPGGGRRVPSAMNQLGYMKTDLEAELRPETDLERYLLQVPEFRKGLFWGVPRYGHPEGEIYKHIREVLDNIDRIPLDPRTRERLRLAAFTHDTFKYIEDKSTPRDWTRHHGALARRFMELHTNDTLLLDLIEYHDEAYFSWRFIHLLKSTTEGTRRLHRLLDIFANDLQLYYLFFKCDTRTGDKNQAPLRWFEQIVPEIEIVHW